MFRGLPSLMVARTRSGIVPAAAGATLVDSYSETNQDILFALDSNPADAQGLGQAFTATGVSIGSAKFYLKKVNSPSGNANAKLYNITGTFGTSAIPTGTALAASDNFDVATLTGSLALVTFTFSGANQYAMTNGSKYCITFEYSGGDSSNTVAAGADSISPTHNGNYSVLTSGSWSGDNTIDTCFYVYST